MHDEFTELSSGKNEDDVRRCEAYDLIPTMDDAVYVRCSEEGIRIAERMPLGGTRTRVVCLLHRGGFTPS